MIVQSLQAPYLIVTLVPNFAGLSLTPQNSFNYGFIQQINWNTINFQVGDIVMFQKPVPYPGFIGQNSTQYYVIPESSIFFVAMSTATKIFDYTFDYTFE